YFETAQDERSPLVSVVIPAYRAKYLPETLKSLIDQDFTDYEIIVGDDCPTNEVYEVFRALLRELPIKNLRYFKRSSPEGGGANLSFCIRQARGEFIKPVFDDDLLLPGAMSKLTAILMCCPELSVVGSRRLLVGEDGEQLPSKIATIAFFDFAVILRGGHVVSFLGALTLNFAGGPSTIMFRACDCVPIVAEHR